MATLRSHIGRAALAAAAVSSCLATAQVATPAVAAPATAHAARACAPPKYPGSGYFTSLRVSGTSCRTGRQVALAHYRCRRANGVRGHCRHRVLHFRCTESRPSSARTRTEYNARVTCTRGSRRVIFTYQQNT
jgi:hypothetical protein